MRFEWNGDKADANRRKYGVTFEEACEVFGDPQHISLEEEYDFSQAVRGRFYRPNKRTTTIRLDDDIVLYFKKQAGERKVGYQTLVNAALREYVNRRLHE